VHSSLKEKENCLMKNKEEAQNHLFGKVERATEF